MLGWPSSRRKHSRRWARMDSAVGTFELAKAWLEMMKPIMPIPVLVVGLSADGWQETDAFRGTRAPRAAPHIVERPPLLDEEPVAARALPTRLS